MTATRKVREAYLAMELEKRYNKTQILEMYLNTVYFGEGAYGAEAAAQTYFARSAKELTLAAGRAARRARAVAEPAGPLRQPRGRGRPAQRGPRPDALQQQDHSRAVRSRPRPTRSCSMRTKEPKDGIYSAPYFVAHVKKALQQQFTPAVVFKGGLTVYTTLDTRLQGYAEKAVEADVQQCQGPRGRARLDRPQDRLRQGAGRRARLHEEQVQPRDTGLSSAGFVVQDVRAGRRDRAGHAALVRGRLIVARRDSRQAQAVDRRQQRGRRARA